MGPAEWVGVPVGSLTLMEGARRLSVRPRRAFAHFTRELRNAVYDIRGYETRNPRTGETERTPGVADRLAAVEAEMKPNGGASLRDAVDKTHLIAVDNNEKHTRIEQRLDSAARLAGEAATRAAKADQGLAELREETQARHVENVRRLDELERQDEDAKILRELLLMSLKDNHGIDLLPDDDDE